MNDFEFLPIVGEIRNTTDPVTALNFAGHAEVVENPLFEEKNRGLSFLPFSASLSDDDKVIDLNTKQEETELKFDANYNTWNNQTKFLANNNFINYFFKEIICMGEDAVPMNCRRDLHRWFMLWI